MFRFPLQQNLSINLKYIEVLGDFNSPLQRISGSGGFIAIQNKVNFWNLKDLWKLEL